MENLIVLGTGNATVTKCYNTCFALEKRINKQYILVDAGGGNTILSLLERKNIQINQIENIIVTHSHTDHVLGIIWMIRMIAQDMLKGKYKNDLKIYAHQELIEKIQIICKLTLAKKLTNLFDNRIYFEEVKDGEKKNILEDEFIFFDIHSEKEKQFGFSLKLKDNKKLTCLGDEPLNEKCEKYAQNSKWLLCEAFCRYADRDIYKPYEKYHSTVKDAAEIAQRLKVENLVLWHTEEDHLKERKELYQKEAKEYYTGTVFVPEDLEEIEI